MKLQLGMVNHHLIKKYGVRAPCCAIFWRALSCLDIKMQHRKNFGAVQPRIQWICHRIPPPACPQPPPRWRRAHNLAAAR